MRFFIEFSYKGTRFHGWQSQPNAISVQQVLTEALQLMLKESLEIVGAGRTDAGVHARQMYAHFDTNYTFDSTILVKKLNSYLPKDIAIHQITLVSDEAHARFDATSRTYEYYVHQRKNPFLKDLSWHCPHPLNSNLMNEAAKILLEYTDFECFSKTHTDVYTYNCNVTEAFWEKKNDQLIFTITANRFLRNMVRAVVGTLIQIGMEKKPVEAMHDIIQSKDRGKAGFSVPADGLFLTKVKYPYL